MECFGDFLLKRSEALQTTASRWQLVHPTSYTGGKGSEEVQATCQLPPPCPQYLVSSRLGNQHCKYSVVLQGSTVKYTPFFHLYLLNLSSKPTFNLTGIVMYLVTFLFTVSFSPVTTSSAIFKQYFFHK